MEAVSQTGRELPRGSLPESASDESSSVCVADSDRLCPPPARKASAKFVTETTRERT